jgi:nicotinamide-nucleotide amidase
VIDDELRVQATKILDACRRQKLKLALAESCTGGLIGAALTEIPGSSDVLDRGYVTYSNKAKATMLGVPTETLRKFGAVSAETARAMAEGALAKSARRHCGGHRRRRPRWWQLR